MSEGAEGTALNAANAVETTVTEASKHGTQWVFARSARTHSPLTWRRRLANCVPKQWLPAQIRRCISSLDGRLTAWLIQRALQRLDAIADGRREETLTRCEKLPLSALLDLGLRTEDIGASPKGKLADTVVKLQARNRELQMLVQLDALTGLRSRRALDQVLHTSCGGPAIGAEHCAVIFLDIDHFGHFNKHHGDDEGDHALRKVAQIIQASTRRGDHVFRKGGEEFVVVLPGANAFDARQVSERMRAAVEAAAIRHAGSPTAAVITVTAGVAVSHLCETDTVARLMNRAAGRTMQAKTASQRNQVHMA